MQMAEESSDFEVNRRQEQELTLSPPGSTQVNNYSRVHDQDACTDLKGEIKVDNVDSKICSNARTRYVLAKLRQEQLQEELELGAHQRILKAKNEVQLAKLEMELSDNADSRFDNVVDHDEVITISNNLKECKITGSDMHISDLHREPSACINYSMDKIDLPKVELEYFDGNPREY